MAALLSIKDLCIQFDNDGKQDTAVNCASFSVGAGELVAIVGESGSGKSVTALSILQLLPKQTTVKGEIIFNNGKPESLLQLTEKKITGFRGNKIAMIFQEPMTSLNPVFTCGYQVMEAIRLHEAVTGKPTKS